MNEKFFDELKEKIKKSMEIGGSHEFSHTERVLKNSLIIASSEKCDLDVVKAAALLHDIARTKEDNGEIKCHAEEGAKEAAKILREIEFPKEKTEKVVISIKSHRLSKSIKPEIKEAQILQDADRLDSLGAILIARAFSSASIHNRPFYDPKGEKQSVISFIKERASKLKPEFFNTKKGREIAKERYTYSEEFIKEFIKEFDMEKK